jgi:hypothetical protein
LGFWKSNSLGCGKAFALETIPFVKTLLCGSFANEFGGPEVCSLEAANEYGWQGQVRFQKYRKTLRGNARTKWDLSVAAGPQNFQIAFFFQNIWHMVAQMASPQAYDKFVDSMHHIKKPASIDPSALVD